MVWSGEGILLRPLAEDRLGEPQNGPGVARPRVPHAYVLAPRLPECPRARRVHEKRADGVGQPAGVPRRVEPAPLTEADRLAELAKPPGHDRAGRQNRTGHVLNPVTAA